MCRQNPNLSLCCIQQRSMKRSSKLWAQLSLELSTEPKCPTQTLSFMKYRGLLTYCPQAYPVRQPQMLCLRTTIFQR